MMLEEDATRLQVALMVEIGVLDFCGRFQLTQTRRHSNLRVQIVH